VERNAGDISDNNQNKKQKATGSNASAHHVQRPKGKRKVANANLINQSSEEALDIMGLNSQQSINALSFLDKVTSLMDKASNVMAFVFAMQTLPEGKMKNMVARQMLAATGIFTPGADRFHSGNQYNTSGSDRVACYV